MSVRPAEAAEQARTFSLRRVVPYVSSDDHDTSSVMNSLKSLNGIDGQIHRQNQLLGKSGNKPTSAGVPQPSRGTPPLLSLAMNQEKPKAHAAHAAPKSNLGGSATATRLSFAFGDAVQLRPSIQAISQPVQSTQSVKSASSNQPISGLSINLRSLKPTTVSGARLAPDAQREAMRLAAVVDSLNSRIATQQASLDAANASVVSLKRQLSTEKSVATQELARMQTEAQHMKQTEATLRKEVNRVANAKVAMETKTVAPLQKRVEDLQGEVMGLKTKLKEKPMVVKETVTETVTIDTSAEQAAMHKEELNNWILCCDALTSDLKDLRLERNAAIEHMAMANLPMSTSECGGFHSESDSESSSDEEDDENYNGMGGGGAMQTGEAVPPTPRDVSLMHRANVMALSMYNQRGSIPRMCAPFLPSLSQLESAELVDTAVMDDPDSFSTSETARSRDHMMILVNAVANDLKDIGVQVKTDQLAQQGKTPEEIQEYMKSIEKIQQSRASAES